MCRGGTEQCGGRWAAPTAGAVSQPLRTRTKKRTNAKLGLGSITREPWARPCRTNSGRICSPSARLCPRTRMVQNIAMCAPSKALTSTPKARRDKPRTDQSSSGRPCASRRARAASTERTRLARSAGLRASRSRLASKIWSAVLTASSTCARPVAAVDSLRAIEQRSARALPLPSLALGLSGCAILPSHTVQPTLSRRGQFPDTCPHVDIGDARAERPDEKLGRRVAGQLAKPAWPARTRHDHQLDGGGVGEVEAWDTGAGAVRRARPRCVAP